MKKILSLIFITLLLMIIPIQSQAWEPSPWGGNSLWNDWLSGHWGANSSPSSGDTKLLLHFDGADEGATFTDSSYYASTVTPVGSVNTESDQKKFGPTSGEFNGTTDYVYLADSSRWVIANGYDFTIDYWIMFTNAANKSYAIMSQYMNSVNYWQITMYFTTSGGNSSIDTHTTLDSVPLFAKGWGCGNLSINTWYHVAIVRNSGSMRAYLNGTEVGFSSVINDSNGDIAAPLTIGYRGNSSHLYVQGYLEELRFSIGVARWTGNFTSPINPYSAD